VVRYSPLPPFGYSDLGTWKKLTRNLSRSETDLKGWLEDRGLKTKPKSTREELVDQVRKNWDATRSYVGSAAERGQQVFKVFSSFPFFFIVWQFGGLSIALFRALDRTLSTTGTIPSCAVICLSTASLRRLPSAKSLFSLPSRSSGRPRTRPTRRPTRPPKPSRLLGMLLPTLPSRRTTLPKTNWTVKSCCLRLRDKLPLLLTPVMNCRCQRLRFLHLGRQQASFVLGGAWCDQEPSAGEA
jgi:hypothetical protein